jgi:tetratricopeptide (TPR) repeat protein
VYESILAKKKKEIHEEIGKGIEELFADNLADRYGVLVEHFFMSENYAKAAEYSRTAGKKAQKAASFPDAIAHARKRIACLEKLPISDEGQKKIIDARTVLGLYLTQLNHYIEAKEAIDPIIDLAIKQDYKRRLCQIRTILGTYHYAVEENFSEAFQAFEEALKISEEIKDVVASVFANHHLAVALSYNCEFDKAIFYMQRSLDINIAAKNLWGIAITKGNLAHYCYLYPGRINLGFQTNAEALRMAEESGDIISKAYAYSSHGTFCYGRGLFEEAEKNLLKGIEFCERLNDKRWNSNAHFFLGDTYFEMGDYPRSEVYYEKACWLSEHAHILPSYVGLGKIELARSRVMNNEKDVDLESLYNHSRNNKIKLADGLISTHLGEVLLNIDERHMLEAERWIQKAIEANQRNGVRLILGKDYALYAELFIRKGDRLKAQENLGKAIGILKECGADGWVSKYDKELYQLG